MSAQEKQEQAIYTGQSSEAHDFKSFSWSSVSPAEHGNAPTGISAAQFMLFWGVPCVQTHHGVFSAQSKRDRAEQMEDTDTEKTLPPSMQRENTHVCVLETETVFLLTQ